MQIIINLKDSNSLSFPVYASIGALILSIISIIFTMRQSRIDAGDILITLLYNQKNKYHLILHSYWDLSKDQKETVKWKKIMRLELQAYANIYEVLCAKYCHYHINRRIIKKTYYKEVIQFYEGNWGEKWGIDFTDESKKSYSYLRKVYKKFKRYETRHE